MQEFDEKKLKKLRFGELCGNIATGICAAVLVIFIVCFSVARSQNLKTLELVSEIVAPILMVAGIVVSAYCNIVFSGKIDKLVGEYVKDTCITNAALFHPERDSLSFIVSFSDLNAYIQVNGYKDKIEFDFTPFKKISLSRKLQIVNEIENKICDTFCKLYDRGVKYSSISYQENDPKRKKTGKVVYIIKEGTPDVKAYKSYLKRAAK
jgi:hypothetical protein